VGLIKRLQSTGKVIEQVVDGFGNKAGRDRFDRKSRPCD
jgi:hypothetical protein